ncbi:hypothetical protein ACFQ7N_36825 [Streptomyces niveus]|uniref:hypothetical protein n=1 Tax=Streptomyces niveus TaxID=193462 RepID=UPI003696C8A4
MPNRLAVITALTQDIVGAQRWDGRKREYVAMPTEDHHAVEDAAAAVLERIARAVDWPRLLRESALRHAFLHPDREVPDREWSSAQGVCGECLAEALLADGSGAPNWHVHPTSPRAHENLDWPVVVSDNLPHRREAHWHPFQTGADHRARGSETP